MKKGLFILGLLIAFCIGSQAQGVLVTKDDSTVLKRNINAKFFKKKTPSIESTSKGKSNVKKDTLIYDPKIKTNLIIKSSKQSNK